MDALWWLCWFVLQCLAGVFVGSLWAALSYRDRRESPRRAAAWRLAAVGVLVAHMFNPVHNLLRLYHLAP